MPHIKNPVNCQTTYALMPNLKSTSIRDANLLINALPLGTSKT